MTTACAPRVRNQSSMLKARKQTVAELQRDLDGMTAERDRLRETVATQ